MIDHARPLSTRGQRIFLTLDKLLNRSFGEALNPFYFLGAIANFLFWIIVFSGLYLYIFFETSVVHAYASVQALTQNQPYAGGLLRSLHRYASDALVLVMALHMLRHVVFHRYQGLRWFSWVSGVLILWLTYASGINGYMLVWDRLSQFVVTTTAQWFDALPVLGGAMARNFISNAHVTDRMFSLLSFIHIGLPLCLMTVLWIHTQRIAGARTLPPRGLMVGLLLCLGALSAIQPAISQSQADMGSVVSTLAFDWFYLPSYALIAPWGPTMVWLLVLGSTAFLLLMPWLSTGKGDQTKGARMAVPQDERFISLQAGETLLDAGLREGLPMPFECRNGGCGLCKCTVLHGQVTLLPYQAWALSAQERSAGVSLLCCAQALGDIEISYTPQEGTPPAPIHRFTARVSSMHALSNHVMRVGLQMDSGSRLVFQAGQYINIILSDGAKRSFSFANAYSDAGYIELHVARVRGGRFSGWVFERMVLGDLVEFEGPIGSFTLRENSDKPIIFVAGATGFAPVKSILEHAFHTGIQRPMVLYWGVRSRADLYLVDQVQGWLAAHTQFSFVPVLSAPLPHDHWTGRTGALLAAILADFPDLSAHQVYACGSVRMVESAQASFAEHGLMQSECFSDAFHLAPQAALHDPAMHLSTAEAPHG